MMKDAAKSPNLNRGVTREEAFGCVGNRIGQLTLQQRQDYNIWIIGQRCIDRAEAESIGYPQAEIDAYFGPAITPHLKAEIILPNKPMVRDRVVTDITITPLSKTVARTMGFTGDICLTCGSSLMIRNGACLICQECGQTTGCA